MKKGIIYSFIISMVICMMMPFNLKADSYMDHIVGTTYSNQNNIITWTFDEHILGSMDVTISYKLSPNGAVNQIRPYIRVNGTQVSYVIYNDWLYDVSFTIDNSYFEPVSSMDLTTIISYLSQMYDTQEDIYNQLQLIYGNTSELLKMREWNFPFESYSAVYPLLRSSLDQVGIKEFNNYTYPIFAAKTDDILFSSPNSTNTKYDRYLIFAINKNLYNLATFSNFFNWNTSDIQITFDSIITSFRSYYDTTYYYIVKFKIHGLSSNTYYISAKSNFNIMPVYFDYVDKSNISTDFALQFGLSNQLLDNLNIVAQGTQQSQSAAGDLEQGTSDLASDISSYNQIESDYNNQMNQALNNIDFSDQFSNNQNFLSGASFVKTVFNSFMQIDILRIFFIVLCIVLIAKRFI